MQTRVVLISVAVAVLGLVVAILGFVAEGAKSKSFVGFDGMYCVYRSTQALGCGIAAALLLLTGQAVLSAASGCFGRCGKARERVALAPEGRRSVAIRMSAISWALAAAATGMFLYGAWRNASARREPIMRGRRRYGGLYGCAVLKGGLFSTASVASVIANVCGITAYVYLETAPQTTQFAAPGIAMGQPHFQPQAYAVMGYPARPPPPPPPPYVGGYGTKALAGTS